MIQPLNFSQLRAPAPRPGTGRCLTPPEQLLAKSGDVQLPLHLLLKLTCLVCPRLSRRSTWGQTGGTHETCATCRGVWVGMWDVLQMQELSSSGAGEG